MKSNRILYLYGFVIIVIQNPHFLLVGQTMSSNQIVHLSFVGFLLFLFCSCMLSMESLHPPHPPPLSLYSMYVSIYPSIYLSIYLFISGWMISIVKGLDCLNISILHPCLGKKTKKTVYEELDFCHCVFLYRHPLWTA
jgi:hypothetical protein